MSNSHTAWTASGAIVRGEVCGRAHWWSSTVTPGKSVNAVRSRVTMVRFDARAVAAMMRSCAPRGRPAWRTATSRSACSVATIRSYVRIADHLAHVIYEALASWATSSSSQSHADLEFGDGDSCDRDVVGLVDCLVELERQCVPRRSGMSCRATEGSLALLDLNQPADLIERGRPI